MSLKTFHVICDIGSAKVYTKDCAFFFSNGIGDGDYKVIVAPDPVPAIIKKRLQSLRFIGNFEVLSEHTALLSEGDCERTPIYAFGIGRWFVYRDEAGTILIVWTDGEVK